MAGPNPEILIWARETAGLDRVTAARKIGLKSAKGVPGEERLAAIEAGEIAPSPSLLRRMAAQYHRPLLTFYLAKVPAPPQVGEDFRTLPDRGDTSNVLLATLLRDVKARQALVREVLEDDEDAAEVSLVGAAAGVTTATALADAMVKAVGFDRATYRAQGRAEDAFNYLRGLIEATGVYVLLAGDCGHWSTAIDVSVFRGFALSDELAPFIVVNDQDAKAAWSFTLLHELAHLLLGVTGVSGGAPSAGIEQQCNDAAAAVLVDEAEIVALQSLLRGRAEDIAHIDALADRARISRTMVAYQLFRVGIINASRWGELRDTFRAHWIAQKEREREKSRGREGGPNWYVVRRHRLGAAILALARQGMSDGSLTPTRAARMLGVKPMNVYPLLAETRRVMA
ncbi:helix-turn-helix domain-containing protein [Sphingomonas sp. Ag1]|uniref:helix-turn-helix domain-containing protein n=1 Tax=Sphingomonas sp. Ag1 TaxID=1642949 RepID=UPI0006227D16|nr:helix-turn-helix transcriptional regulator [Sphingomonas sp. Ag1]KKI18324.1 hypothetical protein XM50_16910 [Sphingomonas sp. Ag1]